MSRFSEVYDSNFELIIRIAYRFTGELEAAEDLCQDCFIKYYEKYGENDLTDKATFYLIRIVKNLSMNYERRKKVEYKIFNRYQANETLYSSESSLSELVKKEQISDIQKALLLVPYKYRLPLILKEYEQLSYSEISGIIKTSVANVKVLIHRSKKIFVDRIKEIDNGNST